MTGQQKKCNNSSQIYQHNSERLEYGIDQLSALYL